MKPFDAYDEYLCITTDDTLRETLPHGNSGYPFAYYLENIWQFDFHCIDWHWHHELEFVSVTEGTALCYVGSDRIELPAGCGLFVNSGALHRYEAADRVIIPNIVFAPSLLAVPGSLLYDTYVHQVLCSAPYQVFRPQVEWQNKILKILTSVYELQGGQDAKKELHTVQFLWQLWEILSDHLKSQGGKAYSAFPAPRQARLQLMMQYIHDHYPEELTLKEIAAAGSVSKSGALHIFQSAIHTPPVSYLIQYRLARAAELLCTTEKPVASIAEETGFASSGYFCRKFKERYQISPTEYRRKKGMLQNAFPIFPSFS